MKRDLKDLLESCKKATRILNLYACFLAFFLANIYPSCALGEVTLRDPTKPLPGFVLEDIQNDLVGEATDETSAGASELILYKIIVSDTRRVANINGKTLRVGDILDGFELIEIESSYVVMKKDSEFKRLSFSNENIKEK